MSKLWHDTGKQIIELPVFTDGGWGDVEQIEIDCVDELPPATDADYLAFLRYDAAIDQQIKNDQSNYDSRDWDDASLPSDLLA